MELEPCRITEAFPGVRALLVQDLLADTVIRTIKCSGKVAGRPPCKTLRSHAIL